jgi:hypothetical protein
MRGNAEKEATMSDDLAREVFQLKQQMKDQNDLQGQANDLMRSLIPALQGLAQEIADLRADLPGYAEKRAAELKAAQEAEKGIYATPLAPKGQ